MGITKFPKNIKDKITYSYPGDKIFKGSKYSNHSSSCWTGHKHQSIFEATQCNYFKISGDYYDIQYKIEIYVNGTHITNHYVDFVLYTSKDKTKILKFVETKGFETPEWKIKRNLVRAIFPKIPYEVVRERPDFYRKNAK